MLTWLDRAARDVLKCARAAKAERPTDGCIQHPLPGPARTRSACTVLRVLEVDGLRVKVGDLEALDGTPIVDVKPILGPVGER